MSLRLLVTGSREWVHAPSVAETLSFYTRLAFEHGSRLEVVHGAASAGADALAASWVARWSRRGWPVSADPHPANWSGPCGPPPGCRPGHRPQRKGGGGEYCPYAGHRRNGLMIESGIHACAAFWRNGSSGTKDCFERAERAGFKPLKILWADRENVDSAWLVERAPDFRSVV